MESSPTPIIKQCAKTKNLTFCQVHQELAEVQDQAVQVEVRDQAVAQVQVEHQDLQE